MTLDAVDPLPRRAARVVLRRFRLADLESFQAYRADPEVGRYQGWVPMTTAAAIMFINAMSVATFGEADQWMQIAIADPVTDQLIGDIGICVHGGADAHTEIGYSIAAAWQQQGLGAEAVRAALAMAFECSGIERVVAVTDARNVASVRLLQRIGMTHTSSADAEFRGEPCTERTFILSRSAFQADRPPVISGR